MSGDNWTRCPICQNLPKEWRNGIDHLYGTISRDEFSKAEQEYKRLKSIETVREDYDIFLGDDGLVSISYLGKCDNCGAEWTFNKTDIKHK